MRWFGNKRLLVLLFILIFFVTLIGLTVGKREKTTFPEMLLKDSISWIQGLLYRPAAAVSAFFGDIRSIFTVYEENRALKETLFYYIKDTQRLNDLEAENARLKEALRFTEEQKNMNRYVWRIAHVIAESPDSLNHTIVIDLGSGDGIRENMAVATTDGLIGRVSRVTPFHSNVQLITDMSERSSTSKSIAVTIKGKEQSSFGILDQYDPVTGLLTMSKIDPYDHELQKGDIVVTSGVGGLFPAGLVVGEVVSRESGVMGITDMAKVKPKARFHNFREVFVIEVPPQEGQP
ncbi:rod shape-determining protein MreC [Paenibacillus thermoaerophilus]|uniref:Cell shape-determining protein MreC n=1 Tax=Paenibacillus thermoaerophilus TaxID=1215385 RepID=A0ABW2V0D5_9BACL|nr:rod shape-determining protein MreC [Paenibacillus thermoaerophilus]TMV17281.1 rod shape-determining protein MreC [Paenibacillus thermoaerophilus]